MPSDSTFLFDQFHPLSYRRDTVSAIMNCIAAGESCSLVGVSGIGKTAILRFVRRPHVTEHYLGQDSKRYLFVIIDFNLAELSEWVIFEFMLNQLSRAVEEEGIRPEVNKELLALHEEVGQKKDKVLAQRLLSRATGLLLKAQFEKIVFFLDEFDDAVRQLDFQFFNNLRGLRDEYRPQIVYVTLTRQLFPIIRKDFEKKAEGFSEIFTRSVFPLTPYDRDDAHRLISELMANRKVDLDEGYAMGLVRATGGHSGMIKAAFDFVVRDPPINSKDVWDRLADDFNVKNECKKIWMSLVTAEQRVLMQVAGSAKWADADDAVAKNLKVKGILTEKSHSNIGFFSPLFANFIRQQTPS